jgi:hypothetical protein
MVLKIEFYQPRSQPCDRCGWLDDAGSVPLEDDTGVSRVFCQQCVVDLVKVCLGLPHDSAVSPPLKTSLPVAGERRRPQIAKAS